MREYFTLLYVVLVFVNTKYEQKQGKQQMGHVKNKSTFRNV